MDYANMNFFLFWRQHCSSCWTYYHRVQLLKMVKEKWQPHVSHAQIRFHFANDFILLKILRIVITKKLHKTDLTFTYLDNIYICLHRLCYVYFQIHLMFRNYLWNYNWFCTFLLLFGYFVHAHLTSHMTSPGFPVSFVFGLTSWCCDV